jgi:gentisate 1,2-dioxygenase
VTTVGPAFGKARITVNGIARVVNLHARRTAHRRVVYVRNWAARGTHTITITALAGARIDIDALIALR